LNMDRLRIQAVPARRAICAICNKDRHCFYVDLDFRGRGICQEDSGFVIIAETALNKAGLSIPTDSILEDHQ
jgi:hypothetical protein